MLTFFMPALRFHGCTINMFTAGAIGMTMQLSASASTIDRFLSLVLCGEAASWDALEPPVPDAEFIARSRHHGVQALLFHRMSGRPEWLGWPTAVRSALEKSNKALIAQDLMRRHYLAELLDAFAAGGIRCLLMKGEALAATHYDGPGTRPRGDADLFIGIADVPRAVEAAKHAGFEVITPVYKGHQFTIVRAREQADAVAFDIHWRILNHPRFARVLSFEEAHKHSESLPLLGEVNALHARHALLVACLHRVAGDRHDPERLIWLYDIHKLASAMQEQDLMEFADRARALGVHAACRDGLLRAQARFHTEIPARVMQSLASVPATAGRARRFRESNLALLLDDWKELPNVKARGALLRELFFPPVETLRRKYALPHETPRPVLYARHIMTGLIDRLRLR